MTPRPFTQCRFEDLPESPPRPHPYFRSESRDVLVRSAPFGDVRIRVRAFGDGSPLVLVHGLMTSSYSYRYLLEPLGAHFRLLVPDLPGAGASDKPDRAYTGTALATFLGELLGALDARGAPVVGNSLGGYLAMRLALVDPGAMGRLVAIHPPALPEPRLHALRVLMRVPGARALLGRIVGRDPLRFAHRNVHYYDEGLKSLEEARAYGEPLSTPEGVRAFAHWLGDALDPAELAAFVRALESRRAAGEPFPVPLCFVYARTDPMVPPRVGEKLAELVPGAEMHWLEKSSHFAHVDTPDDVAAIVRRFCASTVPGEGPRPVAPR